MHLLKDNAVYFLFVILSIHGLVGVRLPQTMYSFRSDLSACSTATTPFVSAPLPMRSTKAKLRSCRDYIHKHPWYTALVITGVGVGVVMSSSWGDGNTNSTIIVNKRTVSDNKNGVVGAPGKVVAIRCISENALKFFGHTNFYAVRYADWYTQATLYGRLTMIRLTGDYRKEKDGTVTFGYDKCGKDEIDMRRIRMDDIDWKYISTTSKEKEIDTHLYNGDVVRVSVPDNLNHTCCYGIVVEESEFCYQYDPLIYCTYNEELYRIAEQDTRIAYICMPSTL